MLSPETLSEYARTDAVAGLAPSPTTNASTRERSGCRVGMRAPAPLTCGGRRSQRGSESPGPVAMELADEDRENEPGREHGRGRLDQALQRTATGKRQERRLGVEAREAGRPERQLPPVLVPGADEREDDEPAEEGDVG